jgi:hypothetical protein
MRSVADICNRDTTCFLGSESPNFNVMYTKTSKNKKRKKNSNISQGNLYCEKFSHCYCVAIVGGREFKCESLVASGVTSASGSLEFMQSDKCVNT